mmetsp:Transcript_17018/g.35333  ORF Transcript_17018/g.35333 Transcript_17018/m.35333 type:complete len:88 (-) Transcript_17018:1974-2237(-)
MVVVPTMSIDACEGHSRPLSSQQSRIIRSFITGLDPERSIHDHLVTIARGSTMSFQHLFTEEVHRGPVLNLLGGNERVWGFMRRTRN